MLVAPIAWVITSAGLILFSRWSLLCANRTHADLMNVLAAIRFRPLSGPAVIAALEKVGFRRHQRAHLLFRDPWRLYDPIVRDALDNPRSEIVSSNIDMIIGPDGALSPLEPRH